MEVGNADFSTLSDERQSGHAHGVEKYDAKCVLAANLRAWMLYAQDHRLPTWSEQGLSKLAGVSRPAIKDMKNAAGSCGIDMLQAVAEQFGMEAWQMLVPDAKPPVKPILGDPMVAEAEIQRRVKGRVAGVLREVASLHGEEEARSDGRPAREPHLASPAAPVESSSHGPLTKRKTERKGKKPKVAPR